MKVNPCKIKAANSRRHRSSGVVERERGGTPFPRFFSEGERDPSLFSSISGIFSAEINEQRRLQDSQFLHMLTYWTVYSLEPFAVSQIYLYMLQITDSYV